MKENWKIIEGYEDYMVSDLGRVKSLKFGKEKILKTSIDGCGYYQVNLSENCKSKNFKIHQLLAIGFLNHSLNGHKNVIDHINNIKTDNRLENLQIISQRKNTSKDKKGKTSKYVGVYYDKKSKKWRSDIQINNKAKYLGLFSDEIDASNAYQEALKKNHIILFIFNILGL